MRPIDADKALKIAESYGTTHGTSLGRHSGIADTIHDEIAKLPTIEAESVRHSEWIRDESQPFASFWMCDECNESFPVRAWGKNLMNYCPNCGAKMDGTVEKRL